MNTTQPRLPLWIIAGLVLPLSPAAVAADTPTGTLTAAVEKLPATIKKEKADKFYAVTVQAAKGSPDSKRAATQFEKTLVDYTADFKEKKITTTELAAKIDKSFTSFTADAKLVLLKVPTTPADCTVRWKPVLFGDWADVNAQGSWVGFGKTVIRVTKAGFKAKELTIDTKQNPTEQPVSLESDR